MLKYAIKRIIALIPVLFIISLVLFGMMHAMPGDPVTLYMPIEPGMTKDRYDQVYRETAEQYGFDKPLPVQYTTWLTKLATGDFGYSSLKRMPVKDAVGVPLKNTLILNLGSTIIAFLFSLWVGIKSAVKQGKVFDRSFQVISMIGYSLPTFFIGLTLIFIFAAKLQWLPFGSMPNRIQTPTDWGYFMSWVKTLVLPTVTLTIGSFASTSRYVRNSMIDALSQDYIRTARAKGLSEKTVIYGHAFRNALIPVVTIVAWSIAGLFGGAAITEQIFVYNGIGRMMIQGVLARDFQLILSMNMFYTILSLSANLLMDIGYALADPRIRLD